MVIDLITTILPLGLPPLIRPLHTPCIPDVTLDFNPQSGKPQFSYIYGVALLGTTAIYLLLNLMSDRGIDAYRTASVLGYCLLPMVGLGGVGMGVGIE